MEAPGWDQLVSGEINAPSQLASIAATRAEIPLKQAQTAETNARSQLYDTENQQQQVALDLSRARSPLEKQAIQRAQLAQAMSTIQSQDPDPSAKWDAAMQKLADEGNDDAKQYIGQYTKDRQERLTGVYSADSPLAAIGASNGGAAAGGKAAQGAGAYDPAQLSLAVSQMSPQQQQAAMQKVTAYKTALAAIDSSPNPAQEFARQAGALGHPEWADPSKYNPLALAGVRREVAAWDGALSSRQFAAGIGAPAPTIPNEVKEAGGTLYGVNPAGTRARPLTPQGQAGLVGTNDQGVGVYHNPVTNRETVGGTRLDAKPGTTGGGGSVFAAKQQAWLDVHPGDSQGALDYASGRGGATHMMGAAQIQIAANGAAGGGAARATGFVGPEAYADDPQAGPRANARNIWVHQSEMGGRGDVAKIERIAVALPPMASPGMPPPPTVTADWRPGKLYVTRNRGAWTLRDGQPVRVW